MRHTFIAGSAIAISVVGITAFTLLAKTSEKRSPPAPPIEQKPPEWATGPGRQAHQVYNLTDPSQLVVVHSELAAMTDQGCFISHWYQTFFTPDGREKGLSVLFWSVDEKDARLSPRFEIKAATYDPARAVIVFNSAGQCRAVVTQPTDNRWKVVAPRLTRDGKPVEPNDDFLALGPTADSATIDTKTPSPTVVLKRGGAEQRYVLKTEGDTAVWVESN